MKCGGVFPAQNEEHNLMQIVKLKVGRDEYMVVRWCTRCGAVVVDSELDSQNISGGVVPMLTPTILYPKE